MDLSLKFLAFDILQPPSMRNLILLFLGVGLTFGILERLFPSAPRKLLRPGISLDLLYWLFTPFVTRTITSITLFVATYATFTVLGWKVDESVMNGFGPLAAQPRWLQMIEVLLIADFIGYWIHRFFHETRFWRFHAVHHSPRTLDWLSAYRMHPLNDAISRVAQALPLLLAGFSPRIIVGYIPFIVVYVVFLHSNLRWTFGPFKYVIASPAFHRWHHTSQEEGIDRNYATIFPIWDLMFRTYFLPDRQPTRFGVKGNDVPESFLGQLAYPFQSSAHGSASSVSDVNSGSPCRLIRGGPETSNCS